ncbi:hypothetical protein [Helicobacter sp. UBA3407]|uniref:hypothetical protein n=1 Tax=Helicobacter TaxID=209 RepID=UPI0026146447|nr:hypothetical protein [Helicobacter sp. UBA3407]
MFELNTSLPNYHNAILYSNKNSQIKDNEKDVNLQSATISNEEAKEALNSRYNSGIYTYHLALDEFPDIAFSEILHKTDSFRSKILKQATNQHIPTENEYQKARDSLNEQLDNILIELYKQEPNLEKNPNNYLIDGAIRMKVFLKMDEENMQTSKQALLNSINSFNCASDTKDLKANLSNYISNVEGVAYNMIEQFNCLFACLDIPKSQQKSIENALSIITSYTYDKSGRLTDSLNIGGYTISWEGDNPTIFQGSYSLKISYSPQEDILLSLSSNFDSSQTFFEVLEQRDKLEKENQELKTKQAYNAYGIPQNTFTKSDSTDSIMQTLLKESKSGNGV